MWRSLVRGSSKPRERAPRALPMTFLMCSLSLSRAQCLVLCKEFSFAILPGRSTTHDWGGRTMWVISSKPRSRAAARWPSNGPVTFSLNRKHIHRPRISAVD
uniref:Putative secreted protein n=1 Tax=Anopheles marajoara TaxID=58244 RepID=A0A2M4C8N3_9DIPT